METAILSNPNRPPVALASGNDHPIVDLPYAAVIDGRQFKGRGISLVAAYVAGLMDPAVLNATRLVRLIFQFDGFSVTLVADAMVRQAANGSGEAELIFTKPTGPHLPQLRHILNAYIAGDLVGLGQTIGVAGTAAPGNPSAAGPAAARMTLRRFVGGAAIGLLTLALVTVAGTLIYQRMFVTTVPAAGTVISTGEVMRATATGQIAFLDLDAGKGEVAVAIQAASGDMQSLVMPCDCKVTANGLREGSTVLIGEPVLRLASESDQLLVEATIPAEMIFDLAGADRVELTFPDGARAFAAADLSPTGSMSGADGQTVILRPDAPLAASAIGNPVKIRILRRSSAFGLWVRSQLAAVFEGI